MSGEKGLGYPRIVKQEPISKQIAKIKAQSEGNLDEVVIVENVVQDPKMVELTDSDSDTKVGADQASTEVQNLRDQVSSLEQLWEIEKMLNSQLRKALIEIMEEQDKLKIQIDQIGAKSSSACAAPNRKGKRKMEDSDIKNSNINQGNFNRIEKCKNCDKKHQGVCRKGEYVCYNCGQKGHFSPLCPNPTRCVCFICGMAGHQAKSCPRSRKRRNA